MEPLEKQTIIPSLKLSGELKIPGDKSLSHRAVMFAALANGKSNLDGLLLGEDVKASLRMFEALGVTISPSLNELKNGDRVTIQSPGFRSFQQAKDVIDCGNSGTTMRLGLGILASLPFSTRLTGDVSLNRRPMDRVIQPLEQLGAQFRIFFEDSKRIIEVRGASNPPKHFSYQSKIASAQIKSALLLACLGLGIPLDYQEPSLSRDHTERMLKHFGFSIQQNQNQIHFKPKQDQNIDGFDFTVPADFSSAAFFIAAATLVRESQLVLLDIGINPTRTGLLEVLKKMGAKVFQRNQKQVCGEPVCDLVVEPARLNSCDVGGPVIPFLIDELPLFAVLASQAKGVSTVSDAAELKVKESNRIDTTVSELQKMGVDIRAKADGFVVRGPTKVKEAQIQSFHDHRIAMSASILALLANKPSVIEDTACVKTSFPEFFEFLGQISH